MQRNYPPGAVTLPTTLPNVDSGEGALFAGGGLQYAGMNEDVITLRDEMAPYVGLLDAYRKVKEEEGTGTLYRLWWLNVMGILVSALA